MSGQGGTSTLRRVGTDANDTNLMLVRQTDRVAQSLRLICQFLLGFNLVSGLLTVVGLAVAVEESNWVMGIIDITVAVAGVAAAALGLMAVKSTENVTPEFATKFWYATTGYSVLYTLYIGLLMLTNFSFISTYLQEYYHCSPISSMTMASLVVVVVAYVMAYFALKAYIFHCLISELKNVDPRARFAATLGKILDR